MRALWPRTMPGTPGKPAPAISYGHAGPTGSQCRPIRNQTDGMLMSRCGSLASRAPPVAERDGDTAKAFDPLSAAPAPARAIVDRSRSAGPASATAPAGERCAVGVVADGHAEPVAVVLG